MEPDISSISKKIWKIMRVAIYMIKRSLNKKKLFMELNMMMKRGKIAGKALGNLMFHNHHHHHHNIHHLFTSRGGRVGGPSDSNHPDDGPQEYEFSCSNTPLYKHYLPYKRKTDHKYPQYYYAPSPLPIDESGNINIDNVNNMLEMMIRDDEASGEICAASPWLPGLGLGRSPAVRQLRITDSPFPVQNTEEGKEVDQAAEDFIKKFYCQLKQQKH